jgi:two-component system, sensor histidine kinase and response regulator
MNAALPHHATESPVQVLVVDDVPQNLVAMRALLGRAGVHMLGASSGAEALELLLQHEVALALLDVQMPEMDGFALAELMRGTQRTRQIPIIFLTALPRDPARSFAGYESGAVDFLFKPVDPQVLLSKVAVFTELHRQRQLLHQRNQALEQMLKLNETMVAVLSHDLRTPLSAILMGAETVRRQVTDGPAARCAVRIQDSARRMNRMIEQLLDFSRIRSDILHLDLQDADLAGVAGPVVAEVQQASGQAQIEVEARGDLSGRFDPDRIGQVLGNLLANAVQHGEPGRPVRLGLDGQAPDRLRLTVANAGHVPADRLQDIFQPFKGGHRAGAGLGLGLYIVQQFVMAHGGTVQASAVNGEVCFAVEWPRRRASA